MQTLRNILYCILMAVAAIAVVGAIGCFLVGMLMSLTGLGTDSGFYRFFNDPLSGGLTIFGGIILGVALFPLASMLDPDFGSRRYGGYEAPPAPTQPVAPPSRAIGGGLYGPVTIGGNRQTRSTPAPRTEAPPTPAALDPFALGGEVLPGSIASFTGGDTIYATDSSDDGEYSSSYTETEGRSHGRLSDGGYTVGDREYDRDGNPTGYTVGTDHYDPDGNYTGYDVGSDRYDPDGNKIGYTVGDYEYDADGNAIGYYTPSGTFYEIN